MTWNFLHISPISEVRRSQKQRIHCADYRGVCIVLVSTGNFDTISGYNGEFRIWVNSDGDFELLFEKPDNVNTNKLIKYDHSPEQKKFVGEDVSCKFSYSYPRPASSIASDVVFVSTFYSTHCKGLLACQTCQTCQTFSITDLIVEYDC